MWRFLPHLIRATGETPQFCCNAHPTPQLGRSGSGERAAEVEVTDFRVAQNLIVRALQANTSALHHDTVCCEAETRTHILLDQE